VKPKDLLDPETLPDDLQWIVSEFKLAPKDPVLLLIAWHWHQVQRAEDTIRAANVELQAAVDGRVEAIAGTAESVAGLSELLVKVQETLEEKPALISAQLEAEIKGPVSTLRELGKSLGGLLKQAEQREERLRRREMLSVLLVGLTLGVLCAVILMLR
jgi:hypothetical protein